jgi:hypothetical protein
MLMVPHAPAPWALPKRRQVGSLKESKGHLEAELERKREEWECKDGERESGMRKLCDEHQVLKKVGWLQAFESQGSEF